MDPLTNDPLDDLIARVNELRTKASLDPTLRRVLDAIRRQLANVLSRTTTSKPSAPAPAFLVSMTWDGALSLRVYGRAVPVNPAYVKHVLEDKGIDIPPGDEIMVDSATARDLIEEALAQLGYDMARLAALRRELLQFFMLADATDERAAKCA
jgi:hypothetical protein